MRDLKDNTLAFVDLTVVIGVGIIFAALMVVAYIIWEMNDQFSSLGAKFVGAEGQATGIAESFNTSMRNVTAGFDSALNLVLITVTIFILAIAISALLILRGR